MEIIIFSLLALGIILLVISFRKDKSNNLEVQLENFSIQLMKEMYQVKKKLKVLEDEMMINEKAK
ncbi:hypothetical protein M1K46_11160 [Fictibacillus sp. WQ 8-8]|uniref:hypothetical protein n=1 Tax=unclassified Fictibacillus TaxID=2644029 RepID=UPI0006A7EC9D|nr:MULTISPECIES: hypothetical protein [unclassified Fictibacillus]MCQ6266223.1 hypothetical protein [Fictibacillus sp. WQ 8-8]MED2972557.1 hypothetical protein [Fictibacillus sp. B-59209]UZJ80647.1 hypothetical protein OKX00_09475 [Fictibacillus sp. KU28468]